MNILFERDRAYHDHNDQMAIFINVTCDVDAADGVPALSLSYIGNKGTEVRRLSAETLFKYHGSHIYGKHREEMRLPTNGYITCRVTDTRGTYKVHSPIVTHDSGTVFRIPFPCKIGSDMIICWHLYFECYILIWLCKENLGTLN